MATTVEYTREAARILQSRLAQKLARHIGRGAAAPVHLIVELQHGFVGEPARKLLERLLHARILLQRGGARHQRRAVRQNAC